jgi:hypothetical protein
MNDYRLEKCDFNALFSTNCGVYSEMNITNHTYMDIDVIEHDGSRRTLPKSFEMRIGMPSDVVLEKRTHIGPIMEVPIPRMDGIRARINHQVLANKGYVYVKEFNVTIAANDNARLVKHPYQSIDYSSVLGRSMDRAREVIDSSLLISVTANDPTGKLNTLYTGFGDNVIQIPVTHDILSKYDEPTISYVFKSNGVPSDTYVTSIADLLGEDDIVELNNGIFPFLSKTEKDIDKHILNHRTYSTKAVQEKLDRMKEEYTREYNKLKKMYDDDKIILNGKIVRLNDLLASKEQECNSLNAKCSSLEGLLAASEAQSYRNAKMVISNNNKEISERKLDIESVKHVSAKQESEFKAWHMVAAVAIPVVAACVGVLVKKWAD